MLAAILLVGGTTNPPPFSLTAPQPAPPPEPNTTANNGYAPAPVPDENLDNPESRHVGQSGAALKPGLYRPNGTQVQGEGFIPYSTVQGEQQRHYHPAPSLNLSVPLE